MSATASTAAWVAGELGEVLLGVALFTGIVLCLVGVILAARACLAPSGAVRVVVNGERVLEGAPGASLLEVLTGAGILVPSACGGRGTCGMCRVSVEGGQGAGARLACRTRLTDELAVRVPEELLGVRHLACTVRSNESVATFVKALVLELPPEARPGGSEPFEAPAGAFVQLTCPPYRARFDELDVPARFRADWDRFDLWRLSAGTDRPTTRAYSLANRPDERDVLVLAVRLATPPPHLPDAPPGVVSSWIFGLAPGDRVDATGPYGHFLGTGSERELVLVGGGVGMAPLRAHAFDQLERRRSPRKVTFWYGARSRGELFWAEDFDRLAAEHGNFEWTVALSDPQPGDDWRGPVGFIHEVLLERYLAAHPDPAACEYFLCGPPLMIEATRRMLAGLGVDPGDVHFDDFGGPARRPSRANGAPR